MPLSIAISCQNKHTYSWPSIVNSELSILLFCLLLSCLFSMIHAYIICACFCGKCLNFVWFPLNPVSSFFLSGTNTVHYIGDFLLTWSCVCDHIRLVVTTGYLSIHFFILVCFFGVDIFIIIYYIVYITNLATTILSLLLALVNNH